MDDGDGETAEANLTVTVIGANDGPTLEAGELIANEDEVATFSLASLGGDVDTDDNGVTLDYEIVSGRSAGSATITGTTLSFDPGDDFQDLQIGDSRDVEVMIRATDRHGASATATTTITVEGRSDAPVANPDAFVFDQTDVTAIVAPLANDTVVDAGNTLRIVQVNGEDVGINRVLLETEGGFRFELSPDDTGSGTNIQTYMFGAQRTELAEDETDSVTFSYTAEDSQGARTTSDVRITFLGLNDGPTLDAGTLSTDEDNLATLDLATLGDDVDSDDDGTTLTYEIVTGPTEGSATITGTTLSFDPGDAFQDLAVGENRDLEVTIRATDRHGASTTATTTIVVEGRNDAPVANDDFRTTDESSTAVVNLLTNDIDIDGDVLTVVEVNGAPPPVSFRSFRKTAAKGGFSMAPQRRFSTPMAGSRILRLARPTRCAFPMSSRMSTVRGPARNSW